MFKIKRILPSFLRILRPSFLNLRSQNEHPFEKQSLTRTHTHVPSSQIASLDGLRGIACLIVFNEHLTYTFTDAFIFGYGGNSTHHPLQLPFVKIPWCGTAMVYVFYTISGYVLSFKSLLSIRAGRLDKFYPSIASSILRRGFRLYLPAIIAICMCAIFVQLGAFRYSWYLWNYPKKEDNYLSLHERPPPLKDNIVSQIWDAAPQAFRMMDWWNWRDKMDARDYDLHVWTVAVEFRASMVLFMSLVGTSVLKPAWRIGANLLIACLCVCTERVDVLLFFVGMLIAEVDLIMKERVQHVSPLPVIEGNTPEFVISRRCWHGRIGNLAWMFMFFFGLYLLSAPVSGVEYAPGYVSLVKLIPSTIKIDKGGFVRAPGAVFVVWATVNSSILEPFLVNGLATYLGKISYALYLVHGNVLKSLGYAILPAIYSLTSADGTKLGLDRLNMIVSWILALLVLLPVTLWLSDIFCCQIDERCIKFSRWIEDIARMKKV